MAEADMANLLALDAALAQLDHIPPTALSNEIVEIGNALGRVLLEPVIAPWDMPLFDNSAVDGYAIGGDAEPGHSLTVIGTSSASEPFAGRIGPGKAVRIATGAVLPEGTIAVAMQEDCQVSEATVIPNVLPATGANCRRAGQDVGAGATIMQGNRRLSAADLSMLAGLGMATARVKRKLRVAIASTGNELVETGQPQAGQICDSNRPLLKAMLAAYPVEIVDLGILPDDEVTTRTRLRQASREADLILTTGGVSVGVRDYVRETVQADGEVIFWRIAIKPGKPLLLGRLDKTPLMGLPGNPVSSFVTFHLALRPLLYRLLGLAQPPLLRIPVRTGFAYRKSATLREFVRVSVAMHEGSLIATPFRSQLSNLISSLLESDGILDLPAGRDSIQPGETYDFIPWTSFGAL